jgi:hypothetical protein
MKRGFIVLAVTGFMTVTLLTGCNKSSEQKVEAAKEDMREAKQGLKDAGTGYLADWKAFQSETERKIQLNENRIDAFKKKMEKAGSTAKIKYGRDVAELEQKNRQLKKKLNEYKDEGQSKWEGFKANLTRDVDGIGKTIENLFRNIG